MPTPKSEASIPPTLLSEKAVYFWAAVILTGAGAGVGAIVLTKLLQSVQHFFWPGTDLLSAASQADPWRHIYVLLGAGALTGAGQIALRRGLAWSSVWPGVPAGLFAVVGAGAVLAATTHGPISAIVLVMELTARDRSFILPLVLAVVTATVVARTLDPRSIYDARFSYREIEQLQRERKPAPT